MGKVGMSREWEASLAIRAAWLHYTGGLTQAEVGARLGVSAIKAHRLVSLAGKLGAVRVIVAGDVVECLALEARLSETFALNEVRVVPDLHESGLPLKALGAEGARFLEQEIGGGGPRLIGLGHGRTLAAAVAALPRMPAGGVRFVSLLGGLTRNYVANPHDVMHGLAEKTAAEAYVVPAPFFANSERDRDVLLSQRGIRDVVAMAREADLMVAGIGTAQLDAQLVASRMIEPGEIAEVRERGGVGEMLGHFFDAAGRPVETSLGARTLSPELSSLAGRRLVAIAGGEAKVEAMRAVLSSGLPTGLITDERTARALIEDAVG